MIELISNLEVSISQRLDHLEMLVLDSSKFPTLIRDDQKKRAIVRSFRIIKASEKSRIAEQAMCLTTMNRLSKRLHKTQIIVCENMVVNCINQYLNSEYLAKKTGEPNDLINAFIFYYESVKALAKVKQLTVVKNCNLLQQINFMSENLGFLIHNVQTSINFVYEREKAKFFTLLKSENRSISPEKRQCDQEEEQRFDQTGKSPHKTKRQLQAYCFQLSKLLNLEHVYLDYFYFSSMDVENRKKILLGNFMKRNVYIQKLIQGYGKNHQSYKQKENIKEKKNSSVNNE